MSAEGLCFVRARGRRMRWNRPLLGAMAFFAGSMLAPHANADLAVIVHADSPVTALSANEVKEIFLARSLRTSGGVRVVPVDQLEGGMAYAVFYEQVVKKSPAQLNSYWSRLIFTGKGRPPVALADDAEVLEFVSANPGMLGYINAEAVTPQVKVVLTVPQP
ncbi:Hypothetical protein HDN1F_29350 [gamma proteobacterium HdN1]|nr:Hypothetical protein HDN1F_29350 [gamma proteobacterium HdN1]